MNTIFARFFYTLASLIISLAFCLFVFQLNRSPYKSSLETKKVKLMLNGLCFVFLIYYLNFMPSP